MTGAVVVVGFGITGHTAAISALDAGAASVTVLDDDPDAPYNSALLCEVVAGRVGADRIRLAAPADERFTRRYSSIVSVDFEGRTAIDTTGAILPYDRLIFADEPRAVRTLAQARQLHEQALPGRRAIIAGAGPAGLELAEALYARGVEISLVYPEPRLAAAFLDADESARLAEIIRRLGVTLYAGRELKDSESGMTMLDDGTELPSDFTVHTDDAVLDPVSEVESAAGRPSASDRPLISFRAPGTTVFVHRRQLSDTAEHSESRARTADSASGRFRAVAVADGRIAHATVIGDQAAAAHLRTLIHLTGPVPSAPADLLSPPPPSGQEPAMDHPQRKRLLVVGHGMVGHRFLQRLVERGATASWQITVLGEEPRPAYDRVHLSSLFDGATPAELSLDHEGAYCAEHGIELRTGDPAVDVDRAARSVRTTSGMHFDYDALVLATGSEPFVPPVPGHDAEGCFVYRTVEDVEAITRYAQGQQVGTVVGGGLLGLEAAGALAKLGLRTHVVEFAPRLMPVQIDDEGGAALRRRIEELGVVVQTSTRTEEVLAGPDGVVTGMRVVRGDDSSLIETGMVVFAAGIRPRDRLARDCGLAVGERGGVSVDRWCRTADPAVYAIGECAQASDGKVYGLVAPGYRMAETAADAIASPHDAKPFDGADTSTKLKLLGVDVASFGDAFATTPGAHTAVFADTAGNVFKKLVVTSAGHLLGGILVGDAQAYDQLRPYSGAAMPLPAPAESYLLNAAPAAAFGPAALPDSANICSCHSVAKGTIRAAILDKACTDINALKACTKAGTGCGSCVPLVKKILEAELAEAGMEVDTGLCEHFRHTRAGLVEIIRATRTTSFERLLAEHGSGDGCEICKPAVGSILASLDGELGGPGHVLSPGQLELQDTNDRFLANMQKNGTYSVIPRIPGGEITADKLLVIGEVARDFGLYTKITGGQRIDLLGARVEQLPAIWRRLVDAGFESGHAYGKALRTVKSCVGSAWCRYGVQDSAKLAVDLELRYRGLRSPHKIKAAVSGCARECAEARGKDFGVIATETGWNLYVGGNGGYTPRHADLFAENLDEKQLIRVVDRFLMFYIRTADRLERTSTWIERMEGGLDHLKAVILDDSLGICDELEAALAAHVASYRDEWAAVLEDSDKLRRFASFVNAPEAPDPSIAFEVEREQIKPLMQISRRPQAVAR